jgi:hypothetical protein
LTEENKKTVWDFLERFEYIPYQQFPEYSSIEGMPCRYFIAKEQHSIIGWLQVIEKKNMLAVIEFGPLGNNVKTIEALFFFALQYYKRRFFSLIRWMPYWYQQIEYEIIYEALRKHFRLLNSSKLISWSSKRISLHEEAETIFKKFSENHRRNIKKAAGLQIECRKINGQTETNAFINGYIKMYQYRKLNIDTVSVQKSFSRLFLYLTTHKKGFFMGAFKEGVLLGGLIIIFQGKTAFYYKGYIDHEQRKMPINHLAFYQAILQSKEEYMQWFDFGGYASNTIDEQLININKFKDGFKGTLIVFPKTEMIGLNYFSGCMNALLSLKSL